MSQQITCHPNCPLRTGRLPDTEAPTDECGPPIAGRIPFYGELRQEIEGKICDRCWRAWLDVQIKIINELALNLGDPRSHEIIEAHARDFFGFSDGSETGTDFAKLGEEKPPEH